MQTSSRGAPAPRTEQDSSSTRRHGLIAMGRGQPVVLLHGSMSSKAQWNALTQRLAPQFQAIAIDLHGYGDNVAEPQRTAFSIDDETEFVLSRLDAFLGRPMPVHLVGHSYGGLVALRIAQLCPARAMSLALYEPMALNLFPVDDPIAAPVHQAAIELTALANRHSNYEAARVLVDLWNGDGTFANLPLPAKAKLAGGAVQTALNYEAEMTCPMQLNDFRSIQAPALLLGGSHSPEIVQRIVRTLAMALPNSQVNWLKANHMAPILASELVNPWISTFIESVAARTGDARSLTSIPVDESAAFLAY